MQIKVAETDNVPTGSIASVQTSTGTSNAEYARYSLKHHDNTPITVPHLPRLPSLSGASSRPRSLLAGRISSSLEALPARSCLRGRSSTSSS